MLSALRHPKILRLWFGQALSSIGDEIYRVGLTWLAVGLIGADTGYMAAAQAASLMLLSFVGGKWADDRDALRTMIGIDIIRALIVIIPVVYFYFAPVPLWLLITVAVMLSGLGAFFDPALQTALPRFLKDASSLRVATGLMSTTTRLARLVGPALIGYLSGFIPPIHFFTMDAMSFLASAASVNALFRIERREGGDRRQIAPPSRIRMSFYQAIAIGFRVVRGRESMSFVLYAKAITGGTWNLVYSLGLALLMQELAPDDTRKFAMVVACYGLGNFVGALSFGSMKRRRSGLMMFSGYCLLGMGFVLTALSPHISWIMSLMMASGFTGPMNELPFVDLVQARFPIADMARVFRLRVALDTSMTLALMLLAPWLFRHLSVRTVIGICGAAWVLTGSVGLMRHRKKLDALN